MFAFCSTTYSDRTNCRLCFRFQDSKRYSKRLLSRQLSGVKRTFRFDRIAAANDPSRTSRPVVLSARIHPTGAELIPLCSTRSNCFARTLKAKQVAIRIAQHCAPNAMIKLHRAR